VTLELRSASSLPLSELAALFNASYQDYFIPFHIDEAAVASMARLFDLDPDAGLVALRDGDPVGLVNLGVRGERGWIGGLGVVPSARRHGVGRSLMEAVHDRAREHGVSRILLEVIEANDAAFRLYESLGYEVTRWLVIGSLAEAGSDPVDETPWEEAHARIREARTELEPWQRQDETLRRYEDNRGILAESGAAIFRGAEGGPVTVMQFAGDEAAAREILSALRSLGAVNLFNEPDSSPLALAAKELGAHTALRQREMARFLQ
jgi:ribosomal protein S18 acetylase RimI-like enzyme